MLVQQFLRFQSVTIGFMRFEVISKCTSHLPRQNYYPITVTAYCVRQKIRQINGTPKMWGFFSVLTNVLEEMEFAKGEYNCFNSKGKPWKGRSQKINGTIITNYMVGNDPSTGHMPFIN